MHLGLSTYALFQQRLLTSHLDAFAAAGARHIELSAARHHFDYTDRPTLRDIAAWFRSNDVTPHLHQPLYTESESRWSRHTQPNLNLISLSKPQRIDAADEVKRAIETAEHIPIRSFVLHLGIPHDPSTAWSEQSIDHAITAIEHLKAFAAPLGVQLLLENLPNDVATPVHLLELLRIGHFDTVGLCLNVAHAHLATDQKQNGILPALDLLAPRTTTLHLSDNDGRTDQHLWPMSLAKDGIDWPTLLPHLEALPLPAILEITHDLNQPLDQICKQFIQTRDTFQRLEDTRSQAPQPEPPPDPER